MQQKQISESIKPILISSLPSKCNDGKLRVAGFSRGNLRKTALERSDGDPAGGEAEGRIIPAASTKKQPRNGVYIDAHFLSTFIQCFLGTSLG